MDASKCLRPLVFGLPLIAVAAVAAFWLTNPEQATQAAVAPGLGTSSGSSSALASSNDLAASGGASHEGWSGSAHLGVALEAGLSNTLLPALGPALLADLLPRLSGQPFGDALEHGPGLLPVDTPLASLATTGGRLVGSAATRSAAPSWAAGGGGSAAWAVVAARGAGVQFIGGGSDLSIAFAPTGTVASFEAGLSSGASGGRGARSTAPLDAASPGREAPANERSFCAGGCCARSSQARDGSDARAPELAAVLADGADSPAAIPEPSTWALMGVGLLLMLTVASRRRARRD